MNKVLVITYYWPPCGGSGVQRWMYFCKYLSEFGYEPIVLTVSEDSASYRNTDESFVDKIKDVETHKTNTFEPLKLYSLLTTGSKNKGIPVGLVRREDQGIFSKLSAFIRGNFFIPDARIGWRKYALKKARALIKENDIKLIVTTGPPHSTHLIGLQLKKEYGLKWVADFRDPWSDIYYNKDFLRSESATRKDLSLERQVLEGADRILTVGFKLKELLQKKIAGSPDKFHHIYNGYDSFAMEQIPEETHDHFEITFIGVLTEQQPYLSAIESLKKFIEHVPNANFRLSLAGNIQPEILDEFKKELPTVNMDIHGYVVHETAMKLMKRSQLLLNFLAVMKDNEILISGKQMEYIATGNPILCIGNTEGESAFILKDIHNARVFEKEQNEESADFITSVYRKWEAKEPYLNEVDNESIKSKSRYETTRELAQFFNEI